LTVAPFPCVIRSAARWSWNHEWLDRQWTFTDGKAQNYTLSLLSRLYSEANVLVVDFRIVCYSVYIAYVTLITGSLADHQYHWPRTVLY